MAKNQLSELDQAGLAMIQATELNGREFSDGKRSFTDYCTTNYLGFDFRPEMHARGMKLAEKWGTLTGWSRLEADPVIYPDLEKKISKFLGSGETILSHTITITNFSLIPSIAEKGVIFCDQKVHTVVWEACRLARDHGAKLTRFNHQDMADLERQLIENKDVSPKLIAVDGVYSISTEYAPIAELQRLCEKYGAWLYVDDAHGFGVLGERPTEVKPYGEGGGGVVKYFGGNFDRTFYVTSFGKAFCTHTAFATVPKLYPHTLREKCLQYVFSAPMPPYVIGLAEASLELNEKEGNQARADLLKTTRAFVDGFKNLGLKFSNHAYFPVVFWEIGNVGTLIPVAKELYASGVIAGLRAYPIVPEAECGMRFGLTRLHTQDQVAKTLEVIKAISRKFDVKRG
jgi:8-amino-7-oxononanoate synthase